MNALDEDFVDYCRACTDSQLRNILEFEWKSYGHRDYVSARVAASERGWHVHNGHVL